MNSVEINDEARHALIKAREIIAKPENWCRGHYARNCDGVPVRTHMPEAYAFCSLGALRKTLNLNDVQVAIALGVAFGDQVYYRAILALIASLPDPNMSIPEFNDDSSHAGVLQAFERAIKNL